MIGALVFFWQQDDSFGEYLLAVLKAVVWPAFLVYEVFQGLLGCGGAHAAGSRSASSHSWWDVELDVLRVESPASVLELTGIEVPDGMPAGWEPPVPVC